jgi:hypothetical protein
MRLYDLTSAIVFMTLGDFFISGGWRLGFGSWRQPGSGFMAVLAGGLPFCLSSLAYSGVQYALAAWQGICPR